MVASEVDGYIGTISSSNSSTHIYCKPVKIKDASKIRDSLEGGDSNGHNKNMTSTVKVPSSVVAIDVSGQPFSRMASFRRSLIHVDFLIRRKRKKDKRRNTVAEGDVKELKDALQKMVNDECQFPIPNSICSYQQIIAESKNAYNTKVHENQKNDKISVERNNNAANTKAMKKPSCINSKENQIILQEKGKNNTLNGEGNELKVNETENTTRHSSSKRKLKSHIPISTVSAAMNVAVEMRQCNGIRTEIPVLNGVCNNNSDHNSSDSDNKLQDNRNSNSSSYNEDGSQEESWTSYKKKLQEKCRTLTNRKILNENNKINKEIEVSSSASSENIDPQDNTTAAASTESDTFFISSDESDEESSDAVYFQENYGSSTSLGTASDGSLNSLLSETGTEMTSSTGTLTSVGREHLLTPPPPPPPMILSATVKDKDIVAKISGSECFGYDTEGVKSKKNAKAESLASKQTKQIKSSKPLKSDLFDLQRNVTENSKTIFASLVSLKTHSKDKCKHKVEKKKLNKNSHQPAFDMYGNNSPTKAKQIPTFIKENISPVIKNEEKSHMKSFFVNDRSKNSIQISDNEMINKSKSDSIPNRNIPYSNSPNISDVTKTKGIQTVSSIPPKYEHQVTVTPVQRCTDVESKNIYHKGSLETENQQNLRHGNMPRPSSVNTESQIYAPRIQRPPPPITLQQERSKAARVVLDFDGKVIYSTNSLDRKHYNTGPNVNMYNTVQNKSCDQHFKETKFTNDDSYYNLCEENQLQRNSQVSPATTIYNSNLPYPHDNAILYPSLNVPFNYNKKQNRSEDEHYLKNDSYHIKQPYDQQFPISNMQSPQNSKSGNMQTFVPKRIDARPYSFAGNSSDTYFNNPSNNLLPDPNISGLPVQETMLTRHNVNLHSKQMEKMNMNVPEDSYNRISDVFCMSSPSQTNSGNILNKSPQSTMSTEDLFAVIHNCKKRMNIKTDSDVSLASSSSRSSSPSYLRPSSSKSTLAETGFLSPRSQVHLETSGDRRSWADFRPVDTICSERKSLASDRLGPTKPTSMHDFKMLLLQARTSSQISGPRKSAVEMLKVPSNQNNRNAIQSLPLNLSPRNCVSMSVQSSPTTDLNLNNGHSTVPFKRGNRVRASLQPRYIMYPPIFEDCSEDSENCDLISNKPSTTAAGIENKNGKENSKWEHNPNNNELLNDQDNVCDNEIKLQPE